MHVAGCNVAAGLMRKMRFSLIVLVGSAIYALYLFPAEGFQWHYVGAVFGIGLMAMLAFQTADIYQVQAFRGYEKQYFRLASAWAVVFLVAMSVTFVAKLGDHYSRVWLGGFYVVGLAVLVVILASAALGSGLLLAAPTLARPRGR